jgi:prevent-host-death family protein
MAKMVNLHAAKTNLSRLVDEAANGEDVVIAKAGKPMVRLVPVAPVKTPRKGFGSLKGKIRIREDFDAPLPPEVLRAFGMK